MDYIIREKARNDLELIWLYTLNEWGMIQADIYTGQLIERFEWLARNPYAGRNRTDIDVISTGIEIIGIPHQQMDVINYFEKP